MEVGWVVHILLGVAKIAFLEIPIGYICLVSIVYICTYNVLVAILMFRVRCI